MSVETPIGEYWAASEDLRRVWEHLRFDQQTYMPRGGASARARQIARIEDSLRERTSAALLEELHRSASDAEGVDKDVLTVSIRDLEAEKRRPRKALHAWAQESSTAFSMWRDARERNDWSSFAPYLARLVDLNRQIADGVGYVAHPMDALLSMYETGPTKAEVDALFDRLRPELLQLSGHRKVRATTPAHVPIADSDLMRLGHALGDLLGFDWSRGAITTAPHPFTSAAGPTDVRITVRQDVPFSDMIKATVHELGHALYEQGVGKRLWGTPAGRGIMPYVHESQSKFFENIVGRRDDFCMTVIKIASDSLGALPSGIDERTLSDEMLHGPISLVRTSADEICFNLHILLRWEIEVALLDGQLQAPDVPTAWNELSARYFGHAPETDRDGCLQDPHWCSRYFGLFTSYVIGNLISAQLADAAERDGIDISGAATTGHFDSVLEWLRRSVHEHGRLHPMAVLVQRATGSSLSADAYLAHLGARYAT
jgi:carboxypeptidase Taq